jgi:arsenical pump membrane protein
MGGDEMSIFLGALDQTWEPFVLVLGLIFIGHCAASDGLFEATGSRLASLPGGGVTLFVSLMLLVAFVTATMNLDTSVVFLTPLVLETARRRGVDERAFLYGSIFMANSASLLFLGSNLTNILVFTGRNLRGVVFTRTMLPAWTSSVILTLIVVALWNWTQLRQNRTTSPSSHPPFRPGMGLIGLCLAAVLMLVLRSPALPVLTTGIVAEIIEIRLLRRTNLASAVKVANIMLLGGLFSFTFGVAIVARLWDYPARIMASAGTWASAAIGAGSANVVNNLPSAALLSSKLPAHPYQLLLGLDLGPNLCVIGAMSSLLWLRIARQSGAKPSARMFSQVGVIVTVTTLGAAILLTQ